MTDQERAQAEKIVGMWINGELATPHDAVRAVAAALAAARREAFTEAADECSRRAYSVGVNEPLRENHMAQFKDWLRAKAQEGV